MKIAYITPGAGGTFYCQNCFRDDELLTSLLLMGHDVRKVPMYLPANVNSASGHIEGTPVFYGAINVYLREKVPLFRQAPNWVEKVFDAPALLQLAAKKSGSTRASGLEEMTISMLQGEEGHQASELEHLIRYLEKEIKPDVVHLSNALLLGLARRLKNDLGAGVICSLQDENEWIDPMTPEYQEKVWNLMARRAEDVDLFITASHYYARRSGEYLKIPEDKIKVIYGGINLKGYELSAHPLDPPVIGYLCRMSEYFGLGILVDAWIRLKKETPFKNTKLYLTGGYSGDDKPFVNSLLSKVEELGFTEDLEIIKDFTKGSRIGFLKSLTLLSVPVPAGEAFGAYQVEALAAGVPIVQPNVGCYPEFVEATGGGVIYEPNDGEHLAEAMARLLADPSAIEKMGSRGREAVLEKFSMEDMAKNMVRLYNGIKS